MSLTKYINNNDLVWEDKGIIIGIIHYLTVNVKKIRNVYIENKLFYKIIKDLFPIFKFYNDFNDDPGKRDINISIKSRKIINKTLVINNIDNIEKIKTLNKDFFLLPWFNVYNPIIMFKYRDDKDEMNITKIKKTAKKFNEERLEHITQGKLPYLTSYKCDIIFWDMFIEYSILKRYSLFFNININGVSDYLYRNVNSFNCPSCIKSPQYIPLYVPYVDPNKKDVIKNVHQDDNASQQFLTKFVGLVNQKIGAMNNILFNFVFNN